MFRFQHNAWWISNTQYMGVIITIMKLYPQSP